MRFLCACGEKEINIPDEKVPQVPKFALKCPFCQKKLVVERVGDSLRSSFAEQPAPPPPPQAQEPKLPAVEPDVFPPGSTSAFMELDDAAWRSAAEDIFKSKGIFYSEADETLVGVAKLRLNSYQVILIEDNEDCAPLLKEINSWPGLKRKGVNVVMVGGAAPSMQPSIAFEKSVNYYLNHADAGRAKELLEECLAGYDLYYRPFAMAEEKV
ncbi:MAG: hypothetical protein AB1916_00995 [Thermodesulfobacteriota bacterium]